MPIMGSDVIHRIGSLAVSTRTTAGNTTLTLFDCVVFATGAHTLTLPSITPVAGVDTVPAGFILIIFPDETNTTTLTPATSDTIDGASSYSLLIETCILLIADGVSNWVPFIGTMP